MFNSTQPYQSVDGLLRLENFTVHLNGSVRFILSGHPDDLANVRFDLWRVAGRNENPDCAGYLAEVAVPALLAGKQCFIGSELLGELEQSRFVGDVVVDVPGTYYWLASMTPILSQTCSPVILERFDAG